MAKYAVYTMTKREAGELDRLLEPLTESAKAEVFDIIEDWHLREKGKAVDKAKYDLKDLIIAELSSNF